MMKGKSLNNLVTASKFYFGFFIMSFIVMMLNKTGPLSGELRGVGLALLILL